MPVCAGGGTAPLFVQGQRCDVTTSSYLLPVIPWCACVFPALASQPVLAAHVPDVSLMGLMPTASGSVAALARGVGGREVCLVS